MKYQEYIVKNRYDLLPESRRSELNKKYVLEYYGKDLASLPEGDQDELIEKLKQKTAEGYSQYMSANIGPQVPLSNVSEKDKEYYKQRVKENLKEENLSSGNLTSFSDFATRFKKSMGENTEKVFGNMNFFDIISSPFDNAGMLMSVASYSANDARQQQARNVMQTSGDKTISGTQFPDVLFAEGLKTSGTVRLLKGIGKDKADPSDQQQFFPTDRSGRIAMGMGSLAADAPFFLASGGAGGFAISKAVTSLADARDDMLKTGRDFTVNDAKNIIVEAGKGYSMGKAIGIISPMASSAGNVLTNKLANSLSFAGYGTASKIAEKLMTGVTKITEAGADASTMMATDFVLNKLLPTTDAQGELTFEDHFTVANYFDMMGMIGLQKMGAAYRRPIKNMSGEQVSSLETIGRKIKGIEDSAFNKTANIGNKEIVNELFRKKIRKEINPTEARELAAASGKTVQEIFNSTPESFREISKSFSNKIGDMVVKNLSDQFVKSNMELMKSQAEGIRENIRKRLAPEFSKEPVFVSKDTISDRLFDNIYKGTQEGTKDTSGYIKEYLYGKKGEKLANLKEIKPQGEDLQLDLFTGEPSALKDMQPILPITKKQFDFLSKIKNLPDSPFLGQVQNASKRVQRLGKEAMEFFIEPWRDVTILAAKHAKRDSKDIDDFVRSLKISQKEITNVGKKMVSEQTMGEKTLKRMKKTAPEILNEKETELYNYLTGRYKEFVKIHNESNLIAGIDKMNEVDNYYPLIRRFTVGERLGFKKAHDKYETEDFQVKSLFARDSATFAKSRVATDRAVELDPIYTYKKYVETFYDSTYKNPIVAKMKQSLNPLKMADGKIYDMSKKAPNTHKELSALVEYMDGIPQFKNTAVNKLLMKMQKNLGVSVLGANISTIANQAGASWGMFTEMPVTTLSVAKDLFNPIKWKEAYRDSRHLLTRSMDSLIADASGTKLISAKDMLNHPLQTIAQASFVPMKMVDQFFATWSFMSAYKSGINSGLSKKDAVRYADQKTIDWSASADKVDLSPIQRTPVGKGLTIFQTHPIQQANWIANDLVGIKFKPKMRKGTKIRPATEGKTLDLSDSIFTNPKKIALTLSSLVAATGISRIYEQGFGVRSPLPDPLGGFFEKDKDGNPISNIEILKKAGRELVSVAPFGGIAEWGPSGISGAHYGQYLKFAEGLAAVMGGRGRGSIQGLIESTAMLAGVPMANQIRKAYNIYKKEQKELGKNSDPMKQFKLAEKNYKKIYNAFDKEYKKAMKGYK